MGDGEGERGGERLKEFEMEEGREREKATQAFMLPRQGLSCWRSQLTLLARCCPRVREKRKGNACLHQCTRGFFFGL